MKVEIKGDDLVITCPLNKPLTLSGSEKSLNLFTSGGVVLTPLIYENHPVQIGVNAFIKNPNYVKPVKAKR